MEDKLQSVIKELQENHPSIKVDDQLTVTVPVEDLLPFMMDLKEKYNFDFLTNLTAVDYPSQKEKKSEEESAEDDGVMEVVYNINSIPEGYTLMVKTSVSRQKPEVPSVFRVWGGAIFQEREAYDLLGVIFTGHPDLRRILLHDGFEGFPLRKDFQWEGGRK